MRNDDDKYMDIVLEFNEALSNHGLDPMKFWRLENYDKKFYLLRWFKCSEPVEFGYGKMSVRVKETKRRKAQFFEWIKTTRNYHNIKQT